MNSIDRPEFLQVKHLLAALDEAEGECIQVYHPSSKVTAIFFLTLITAKEALNLADQPSFSCSLMCQYGSALIITGIFFSLVFASQIKCTVDSLGITMNQIWTVRKYFDDLPSSYLLSEDVLHMQLPVSVTKKIRKYPICPDNIARNLKSRLLMLLNVESHDSEEKLESLYTYFEKCRNYSLNLEAFLIENISRKNLSSLGVLICKYSLLNLKKNCVEFAKQKLINQINYPKYEDRQDNEDVAECFMNFLEKHETNGEIQSFLIEHTSQKNIKIMHQLACNYSLEKVIQNSLNHYFQNLRIEEKIKG